MAKGKIKAKPAEQTQPKSILEQFAEEGVPGFKAPVREAPVAKPGADLESLQKRIDELSQNLEAKQRENLALLSTPLTKTAAIEQKAPAVDLKGLPDPAVDPDAYGAALQERVSAGIAAAITAADNARDAAQNQRGNQQQQIDGLWADFSEKYDDLAEHSDIVEFAAQKVIQRAVQRGIDPQRYMFVTREQFMSDVAKDARKFLPKEEDDDEGDQSGDPKTRDEDDGRTGGIFGGQESGGKPAKGGTEKPGDMIKDIKDLQKASGFY